MSKSACRFRFLQILLLAAFAQLSLAAENFPTLISLPNGWLPEGIETGRGPVIYSGSRANGGIYAVDLRTGKGSILVPAQPGRSAVGLAFDPRSNFIFVAGGATGDGYVYDAETGAAVATYPLALDAPTFINDVVVTADAAYFTDSNQPILYRVPLGPGGRLPAAEAVEAVSLGGEYQQVAGFNANGIVATPNGQSLIIVNSALGVLYEVDPGTGLATAIDVGGAALTMGDGLLLDGRTLYVVRNRLNEIVVIELSADLESGTVVDVITDPNFDTPTTLAQFGDRLYAVNARFTTPPTPQTEYHIVQVPRRVGTIIEGQPDNPAKRLLDVLRLLQPMERLRYGVLVGEQATLGLSRREPGFTQLGTRLREPRLNEAVVYVLTRNANLVSKCIGHSKCSRGAHSIAERHRQRRRHVDAILPR
jgi:sugar lactone lactonase YvrE